jgi:transposase-like protein
MRKHYSAQQKTEMVLEMLKESKAVAQIASENEVHPNQLYRWKAQVLEGLPGLFGAGEKAERERQAAQEEKVEALYAEIGRLTTQVTWLEKKSGLKPEPR